MIPLASSLNNACTANALPSNCCLTCSCRVSISPCSKCHSMAACIQTAFDSKAGIVELICPTAATPLVANGRHSPLSHPPPTTPPPHQIQPEPATSSFVMTAVAPDSPDTVPLQVGVRAEAHCLLQPPPPASSHPPSPQEVAPCGRPPLLAEGVPQLLWGPMPRV